MTLLLLHIVCVFPCHWPLGLLLRTGGHGVFNGCSDLGACLACEGETGTGEFAQVLNQ